MLDVAYNIAKNTIVVIKDSHGKIEACSMWNNCYYACTEQMAKTWIPDSPDGDCILIQVGIAENTAAMKKAAASILMKCPEIFTKRIFLPRMRQGKMQIIETKINLFKKLLAI
jgi:hypothetical protein